jgi:hypothetical protein
VGALGRRASALARSIRLDNFLTFYGPGGFRPDDVEALESVQKGAGAWREVPWSVMTRGMEKASSSTRRLHLREFWIHWDRHTVSSPWERAGEKVALDSPGRDFLFTGGAPRCVEAGRWLALLTDDALLGSLERYARCRPQTRSSSSTTSTALRPRRLKDPQATRISAIRAHGG